MVCTKECQELVLILPSNKVFVIDKCKPMLHILHGSLILTNLLISSIFLKY